MTDVERELEGAMAALDIAALRRAYVDNDEFVFVERFLPSRLIERFTAELEALKPHVHRSRIPGHKKGGSIDSHTIYRLGPTMRDVYRSPAFLAFIARLTAAPVQLCPPRDPHACALYCYTEAGDHIGYHYDTSYYRDRRYTVLLGVIDRSSSRLAYKLHTRNPRRRVEEGELATSPGSLVLFNGDKLLHKVTPLGEGEERIIITLQYVTDPGMNAFLRFVSNMKDAIAYFGFGMVFARRSSQLHRNEPAASNPA
jgi:hypothetical protein